MSTYPLNEKVSRLIQYINELSQLRQKPVLSYRNYEDILWVHKDIPNEPETSDAFRNSSDDWLFVKKPKYPKAPDLPMELSDWIVIDTYDLTITVHDSILKKEVIDEQLEFTEVFLKDLPETQNDIDNFIQEKWDTFIAESERVKKTQKLYDNLFAIYQNLHLNTESLELVLGIGLLQWKTDTSNLVERHVLVTPVELFFDKDRAEFTIRQTSKGKTFEYEEDMLLVENRLQGDDTKEVQNLLSELEAENDLLPQLETILINISNALDSQGSYINTLDIPTIQQKHAPTISLSPAFILRKKTQKSFKRACETAVEQLENITNDSDIPINLANMFRVDTNSDADTSEENHSTAYMKHEFYFPLSANEEQRRIISALNSKNSVLVQGPPGTGKTHTIANLTSHLLATGQRVLITSQTAKALNVVKSKLPEQLQDLTVSLLGGDSASIKDLEKVVGTISLNKERLNLREQSAIVEKEESRLSHLKQQLNKNKTELFEIRESETYVHDFNPTYKGTASQVADKINKDKSFFDWYTSNVTIQTPSSFCDKERQCVSEYISLKSMYTDVPKEYEQYEYPTIPKDIDFNLILSAIERDLQLLSEYELLKSKESEEHQNLLIELSSDDRTLLQDKLQKLDALKHQLLFSAYPVLTTVLNDIFSNRGHIWLEMNTRAKTLIQTIKVHKDKVDEELFETGNLSSAVLKKMTEDLYAHIQNGGDLGNFLIKPKVVSQYKKQLKQVKYNGQFIKDKDHVVLLYSYTQLRIAKEQLKEIIIPTFLSSFVNPITALGESEQVIEQLTMALNTHDWREDLLNTFPFLSKDSFNDEMIKKLIENITIIELKKAIQTNKSILDQMIDTLKGAIKEKTHPLYFGLLNSVQNRDSDKFQQQHKIYSYFQEVKSRDEKVNTIYSHLLKDSTTLAKSLSETYTDPVWEQRLKSWEKAFQWQQVKRWLDDFSSRNESDLSKKFDDTEKQIKQAIINIGTTKAWINMLQSMTDSQNMHLKAWAKSVKNMGKMTGKNAPKYREEAQKHMEYCIDAIPAWIMPLNQVFDNFKIKPNLFDVVIIDEASQSWHDAILLQYIAKKMIIVGDDKQISPTIIGVNESDITKLQHKYFSDINFEFGTDLNLKNSFFDICYIMFKETITLREHFRCMPEIIGFSNSISYQDKPLIPLRQYPANRLEPIKTVYLSEGVRIGSSQNATNDVEANAIVEQIKECVFEKNYDGKTIGVISLQGSAQSKLIQDKLLNILGAEIMEERKIICGDAYSFQGDERDIIFLSMVAAKGEKRITPLTDDKARQRFNVAVSRAKDQLWLMHSITVNDITNKDCMRYQLLSYIANPLREETESNRLKCESEFERNVFDEITGKGYRVIPQYEVAGYRIDLVVVGEKTKLAVECDGDYWHTSPEDRERDFQRERVLQRAGWTFWRVLGSTYYYNSKNAMESLWAKLKEMDIQPYLEWQKDEELNEVNYKVDSTSSHPSLSLDDEELASLNSYTVSDIKSDRISNLNINDQSKESVSTKKTVQVLEKKVALKTPAETLNKTNPTDETREIKKLSQSQLLKELKNKGFKVIDHRYISETVWLVGGEELRPFVEVFKKMKVIFRYVEKGHSLTHYKPSWFAKIKPEKEKN